MLNSLDRVLKHEDWESPMIDFIKGNNQDWATIARALAMEVGDCENFGGGAAGDSWIERIK